MKRFPKEVRMRINACFVIFPQFSSICFVLDPSAVHSEKDEESGDKEIEIAWEKEVSIAGHEPHSFKMHLKKTHVITKKDPEDINILKTYFNYKNVSKALQLNNTRGIRWKSAVTIICMKQIYIMELVKYKYMRSY